MNKLHIALLIIAGLMLVKCEEVATFAEYDKEQSEVIDSAVEPTETEGSAVVTDANSAANENTEETTTGTQDDTNNSAENATGDQPAEETGSQPTEEGSTQQTEELPKAFDAEQTGEVTTEQSGEVTTGQTGEVTTEQSGEVTTGQTGEVTTEQSGEPTKETTSSSAATENTKEEKNEDMTAEADEMYQQSNLATKHAQSMADLREKLITIKELYANKRAADEYSAAQAQAAAFTGVEKELQHHSAPVKDVLLPSQMPVEPMLLRRYKQLQRFDAPLPVEPMPSLYFNRPGKPEKYGNYLEADSDHTLYPQQYYPAQPSVIERRRMADKFEQIKSTIPNYSLINHLNADAIRQGMVY